MMCVIDYGVGNLRSITKGLEKAGATVKLTTKIEDILNAEAIVLPGVGAFKDAVKKMEPLKEVLLKEVEDGKPILGICLGLQILFEESFEGGRCEGLALIKGRVIRLPSEVKVPHIGWNTIKIKKKNPLLREVNDGAYVYFVHSYYATPDNEEVIVATTKYGVEFPSVICDGNIFATQFHPEKSGEVGLKILRNFVAIVKGSI
ncbi:MAG: imidazole glycerol phosphate synthase subunit HisH [Candidatus Jordarchaeales archaeon]|nr:imidazole glycerol phosphate synthase subunit HisH [Candidatus Jordarchaeia archaeon]